MHKQYNPKYRKLSIPFSSTSFSNLGWVKINFNNFEFSSQYMPQTCRISCKLHIDQVERGSYWFLALVHITQTFRVIAGRLVIQWNLIIKRSDITKPSYNKVIWLVPALCISLFSYPDIMRNLI